MVKHVVNLYSWAGKMTQLVNCLSSKPKDLHLDPHYTHKSQLWQCVSVTPVPGEKGTETGLSWDFAHVHT